jgi:hypothetical protein
MNECPTCGRKLRGDDCPYCDEEEFGIGESEATPVSGESMVVVYSTDIKRQADLVMSLLESEGIPAYVGSPDSEIDFHNVVDDIDGQMVIMVEEEDAERAAELIKAEEQELEEDDD